MPASAVAASAMTTIRVPLAMSVPLLDQPPDHTLRLREVNARNVVIKQRINAVISSPRETCLSIRDFKTGRNASFKSAPRLIQFVFREHEPLGRDPELLLRRSDRAQC